MQTENRRKNTSILFSFQSWPNKLSWEAGVTISCIYQLPFSKHTPSNKQQDILADGRTFALMFIEKAPSLLIFFSNCIIKFLYEAKSVHFNRSFFPTSMPHWLKKQSPVRFEWSTWQHQGQEDGCTPCFPQEGTFLFYSQIIALNYPSTLEYAYFYTHFSSQDSSSSKVFQLTATMNVFPAQLCTCISLQHHTLLF